VTPDELAAVRILTRDRHDQPEGAYARYIDRITTEPGRPGELAREVKRADTRHNLGLLTPELERLRPRDERTIERLG
jgi:hypothetical protein